MKFNNKKLYAFIITILGIGATAMLLLPSLVFEATETSFTGLEAVFGTQFISLGIFGSGQIELSILGIAAYCLPLLAAVIAVMYYKNSGAVVSMFLFTASAVLLLLLPTYSVSTATVLGITNVLDVSWIMGSGLIIASTICICGALICFAKTLSSRS